MAEACFYTVCSADTYQWFIPLYVYSTKRAYPEYYVKVNVKGELDKTICDALDIIRQSSDAHWEVKDKAYDNIIMRKSTCNCLRYLDVDGELRKYKYAVFTDVDMIHFRHMPSHVEYYADVMRRTHLPYAGMRGALRRPRRREIIGRDGWGGDYHRIVGGLFAVKTKPWIQATHDEYKRYNGIARTGKVDGRDNMPWGAYPEYDEVMLARIIRFSGLSLPMRKFRFVDDVKFNMRYRDIHLGDFEGAKWKDKNKLRARLTAWAVKQYRKLEEDDVWRELVKMCCSDDRVRRLIHNLRVYAKIK